MDESQVCTCSSGLLEEPGVGFASIQVPLIKDNDLLFPLAPIDILYVISSIISKVLFLIVRYSPELLKELHDVSINVPVGEAAGSKSSTLTFIATKDFS